MFAFLAILRRNGFPADIESRIGEAAGRALPWADRLETERWSAPSGRIGVWTWTNENPKATGNAAFTPETATINLGVRSGTVCHIATDRVTCSTTLVRQDPVYYANHGDEIILANRALLTAVLLHPQGRLEFDLAALIEGFANGYNSGGFLTNRTPFAGVCLAPPNARLTVSAEGVSLSDPDRLFEEFGFGSDEPDDRFYHDVGDIFLARLREVASGIPDLKFGITGGKDSRLLGAALKSLGIEFSTYTTGFDVDPDVVIGRKVAEFLGAPHEQFVPAHVETPCGKLLALDVRGEYSRELFLSDGLNFTVPSLPRRVSSTENYNDPEFKPHLSITTDGAEIWRGGYASRDFSWFLPESEMERVSAAQVEAALQDVWSRNAHFLKNDWRRSHDKMVTEWFAPCVARGRPTAAAERFYIEFEVGRRLASLVTFARSRKGYFQPFIASDILHKIGKLHPRFRRDNYLHYHLTKRFAPGLELLPFESARWGFEWNGPVDEADRAAWLARAPIPYTPQTYGAWPMYGSMGSESWRRFFDELFCYEDGENVFSFLDRSALLAAFKSDEIFTPELSSLFWTVYGLSVMMSGDWLSPPDIPECLVYARYEKPWAEIYRELCKEAAKAEAAVLDELAIGIAEHLARSAKEAPNAEREPRSLLSTGGNVLASARLAPGKGMRLSATAQQDGGRVVWGIAVDSEVGASPASSYLILPLETIGPVRSYANVTVRFRCRADTTSKGQCYLARYDRNGRQNLRGPMLSYGQEWQTVEHVFALAPGVELKRVDFLLGLPVRKANAEVDSLAIDIAPRPRPAKPSVLAGSAVADLASRLRATAGLIAARYALSASDAETLLRASGLDDPMLEPAGPYECARFDSWVAETCAREADAAAVAARLVKSRQHWPLLGRCIGVAEEARVRLLEKGCAV
jgi:hypothetical protein